MDDHRLLLAGQSSRETGFDPYDKQYSQKISNLELAHCLIYCNLLFRFLVRLGIRGSACQIHLVGTLVLLVLSVQ